MSIFRKDGNGNITKLASNIIQKIFERYFVCVRVLEDGIEYYDVPNEFADFSNTLRDYTAYIFKMDNPNTTTTPKLRYKDIVLDIKNSDNSEIIVGQLKSTYQYIVSLSESKIYALIGGKGNLGTVVTVGEEIVDSLLFSSDPQLQIDNIVDGTTIVKKAEQDELGRNIKDTYALKTFFENFYIIKTDVLSAILSDEKPIANDNNYLQTTTTNTTIDFDSPQKIVISRTLLNDLEISEQNGIDITLSFAINRNASLEFAARVFVDDELIGSEQAFGLRQYDGNAQYSNVHDTTFTKSLDKINGVQTFMAGQTVRIEIVTRQSSSQSAITKYFCGVNVGGIDRNCFLSLNFSNISINGSQIKNDSISKDKFAQDVYDEFALLNDVIRTDTMAPNTTLQRATARLNSFLSLDNILISTPGWKRLAKFSYYTFFNLTISTNWDQVEPCISQWAVSFGNKNNVNSIRINQIIANDLKNVFSKIRITSDGTDYYLEVYFNLSSGSQNCKFAIDNIVPVYINNLANGNFELYNFEPVTSDNGLTILKEVNCVTGGMAIDGASIFGIDISKIIPSTENGWSQGSKSTIMSNLPIGVYLIYMKDITWPSTTHAPGAWGIFVNTGELYNRIPMSTSSNTYMCFLNEGNGVTLTSDLGTATACKFFYKKI